ncbi:FAD binding domain-containing protein [Zalerion maritima]|uniref:FAD binding domain-containing protein n=1 Tax=Zalerion maritima TaxID=339359 RepID=A0AAD5WRJ6_9PEZI|nr:FAD binding domain-containing protein [Zalerion maritima]
MGNAASTPFGDCLNSVCDGMENCVAYPTTPFYHIEWAKSYNLDHIITPKAVVRPNSTNDVSEFVKCAAEYDIKVQARSGGHSYGNHGLGGEDGALSIDLVNLQKFEMDEETWHATIGGGTHLGDVTDRMHDNGNRAMAHGTCPGVGIGGHATVGGIGPASRMWGTCMDHVLEVEVVTADGTVVRASEDENSDLFFGMKGAGASFGIVTEFVVKTHDEPGTAVQYTYNLVFGSPSEIAPVYEAWQELAAEPALDRRYASEFILHALGAVVTVTFYGTEDEFNDTGIPQKMPFGGQGEPAKLILDSWLGMVAAAAQNEALYITDTPMPFNTKSVGLTASQIPDSDEIESFFDWVDSTDKGTPLWFLIWSVAGGAINDIPSNATAFAHRDKLLYYDSYGIGVGDTVETFIAGAHSRVLDTTGLSSTDFPTYAGYIDVDLADGTAQNVYWGDNLPALMEVKKTWDPNNVFSNPQSVRVAP